MLVGAAVTTAAYVAIVQRLQAGGIVTTRTTVARDVAALRQEFASVTRNFDALTEIAVRAERFRTIAARAMRASVKTTDDGHRARLLRVATGAFNSEIELLQTCGLLPRDLGTLRVVDPASERLPSGEDLQKFFESVTVDASELVSPAELAYKYGDAAQSERAALERTTATTGRTGRRAGRTDRPRSKRTSKSRVSRQMATGGGLRAQSGSGGSALVLLDLTCHSAG